MDKRTVYGRLPVLPELGVFAGGYANRALSYDKVFWDKLREYESLLKKASTSVAPIVMLNYRRWPFIVIERFRIGVEYSMMRD